MFKLLKIFIISLIISFTMDKVKIKSIFQHNRTYIRKINYIYDNEIDICIKFIAPPIEFGFENYPSDEEILYWALHADDIINSIHRSKCEIESYEKKIVYGKYNTFNYNIKYVYKNGLIIIINYFNPLNIVLKFNDIEIINLVNDAIYNSKNMIEIEKNFKIINSINFEFECNIILK
jgi:hypothetical protein